MFVFLEGSYPKGIVPNHFVTVNPGAHLGTDKVPASWCEKNPAGQIVGREFHIHFINGRADAEPGIGEYLVTRGFALRERWTPPKESPVAEALDPHWRWREGAED